VSRRPFRPATYPRDNGERAAPAARASTIMRRAATPAPATSPATCRSSGCAMIEYVATLTAISVAATYAAAMAVFCSRASVPKIPGRMPCSAGSCRISRPNKPHAAPADGQCLQWGRGRLRNDRHALNRCRPPNHIRRLAQGVSRPGMQQRQDRFRAVGYGQSWQDRSVLWRHGQPLTCRPRYSFRLPAGHVSTQLLDPTTGKLPTAVIIRSARPPGVPETSSGSEAHHTGKTV
jgi:hypothetical protein